MKKKYKKLVQPYSLVLQYQISHKKYKIVKIIKKILINFKKFIGPCVKIKSKQNHATFGHLSNHNKDLSILCSYRYFTLTYFCPRERAFSLFGNIICKNEYT